MHIGTLNNLILDQIVAKKSSTLVATVRPQPQNSQQAAKIFLHPQAFGEYMHEAAVNRNLILDPHIVVADECVVFDQNTKPLILMGNQFDQYSYMMMPYHGKGSLINFILKAYPQRGP